jgi:hypothetical protein
VTMPCACMSVKQFLREAIDSYGISDWYYSEVPNTLEVCV